MHGARILLIPCDVSRIETDKREKSFAWYQNETVEKPLEGSIGLGCGGSLTIPRLEIGP